MKKSISGLGKWTRVVENVPDKVKVKAGVGHKVVLVPQDERTLKIKVVNDADVLTVDKKLTPSGFKAIIDFIKQQPSVIGYYSALNDLKSNLVVYTVSKDTDRTQLITFTIGKKSEIGGINPQVQYVRQDELELAKTGAILNVSGSATTNITTGSTAAGFKVPLSQDKIKDSADPKLVAWMKETWRKIMKEPVASSNPIMAKVKKEVGAGKLGKDSQVFIMGLNAGYNVFDWSGEDLETGITQTLIDKVALTPAVTESRFYLSIDGRRLVEQLSTTVSGFDPDKFNAEIAKAQAGSAVDTGGIVVPPDGFKYGIRGDLEFKKFQEILVKNLPTYAGGAIIKDRPVANFVKAVPMKGDYGDRTRDLIQYLKIGLSDPKYPDNDAQVVKADFVQRMLKEFKLIGESTSFLGLDGFSIVSEGFDQAAANAGTGGGGNRGGGGGGTVVKEKSQKSKVYELQEKPEYEYALVNKIVHYRKKGSGGKWILNTNPQTIKLVIALAKTDGLDYSYALIGKDSSGNVTRLDTKDYYLKDNKWKVWLNNRWTDVIETTANKLKSFYEKGKAVISSSGGGASGSSTSVAGSLNADQLKSLSSTIRSIASTKGLSERLIGDSDADKVSATLDAVTWKINEDGDSSDSFDVYQILADGTFNAKIKTTSPSRTISGKISSDMKNIVLSSGITLSLEKAIDTVVDWDVNKAKLSDANVVSIAYSLKESMKGGSTDEAEFFPNFKKIKTIPDLKRVLFRFDKIGDGDNLSSWIKEEGQTPSNHNLAGWCCKQLFYNGIISRKEYYEETDGYEFLFKIFSKVKYK
jgi:hypothetical protein